MLHTSLVRMHACVQAQGATYISGDAHMVVSTHKGRPWCMGGLVDIFLLFIFSVPGKIHHFLFL